MAADKEFESLFDDKLISSLVVGIGEVADITGIPTRKIRYWEEKGIICSVSETGNVRRYNYVNIKKLLLIKELIEEGYTLEAASKKVDERISRLVRAFEQLSQRMEKPDGQI